MRTVRATHNALAVSAANAETAINTEQTLDLSLLCSVDDVISLTPRRENNADELTGKEEPDTVYDLGRTAEGSLSFPKAQPQHFAFLCAYALGVCSTAAAGTGYEHTITPMQNDLDGARSNPSFTCGQKYAGVLKRLFASFFVDTVTAQFAADSWVSINADLKGTGKATDNVIQETVSALDNAESLTLAANGVHGSTAQDRLDNVHQIKVELDSGEWTEVEFSGVSDADPAVITITDPGGAGATVNYKVLYVPTEAAWGAFPSRVSETPLRVAQLAVAIGGAWDGSGFVGGRTLAAEINSIEWSLQNNLAVEFVPGAADAYASRAFREGRSQTLKLDREFREYVVQQYMDSNETFGVHLLCQGAIFDDPHKFQVELIFPRVAVLTAPLNVNGKRMAEAGDLTVLEDDAYGSVIVKVKNLQSGYAA
ncbi:hypothetical protein Dalk_3549 [Desulfatibacillum aliphaticivorans]|uniref:Uncharacterized protein n=1 Tax=Desulfatibacillum aliphaticivorans TaxID=218208 RepID=B8FC32_DESAL|nr:hypothetical protein [Desulfatibacillum aliphaticivorans]ACL05237.1 hypothetical protein Dalk_3549 [Desulfatibacillum aliphaticivorans]